MDIHLSAEQESRLAELAARDGRSPGEVATEAVARYLDEEARFAEMVNSALRQPIAASLSLLTRHGRGSSKF